MSKKSKAEGISFFQKYLSVWVLLCMVAGILIGKFLPVIPTFLDKLSIAGISIPIAILIWVMIYSTLFISVVLFVVIPLVGGIMTRTFMIKNKGKKYFEKVFIHKFDNATTMGLLLTLVLIFASQTEVILSNPLHIVLIAVPLTIQTVFIFAISFVASKLLKLSHDIAAPAGMIGASNFFELAVAVAIALFGTTSPAALATTVGVLTEVPVMLALCWFTNKTRRWFQ